MNIKVLSLSMILTSVVLTNSVFASELVGNLRCSGHALGESLDKVPGRLMMLGSDGEPKRLVISLSDSENESVFSSSILLKEENQHTRKLNKNEQGKVVNFDKIIFRNEISLDEKANVLIKNTDLKMKSPLRSIIATEDKPIISSDARVMISTIRQDSLWVRGGQRTILNGKADYEESFNIGCKFGEKLSPKQFESLKKETGLGEDGKSWWQKLEFKVPSHFSLLPS